MLPPFIVSVIIGFYNVKGVSLFKIVFWQINGWLIQRWAHFEDGTKSEQDIWLRHVEHFRKDSSAISRRYADISKNRELYIAFSMMFFGKEKHFLWLCIIKEV